MVPVHHCTLKGRRLHQVLWHMSRRQVGTASLGLEFGLDIDALKVGQRQFRGRRRMAVENVCLATYPSQEGCAQAANSCSGASDILRRRCDAPPADYASWTHGRGWFPPVALYTQCDVRERRPGLVCCAVCVLQKWHRSVEMEVRVSMSVMVAMP